VTRVFLRLFLAAVQPWTAFAQVPDSTQADTLRSSITGTVRDSLGFPVTGASVLITPGGMIYRTDSAGSFDARNIAPGALTIGVRKLGFSPLQSRVSLHIGVDLALDLVMQRLPQMLAEVEVRTQRQCSRYALDGILCRLEAGQGHFMNRQQVLAASKDVYFPNLVLRDAPGFRQNLNGNPTTVESIVVGGAGAGSLMVGTREPGGTSIDRKTSTPSRSINRRISRRNTVTGTGAHRAAGGTRSPRPARSSSCGR